MNRILFIFILAWTFYVPGHAQSQDSVQVYDGTTLFTGDTIRIGYKGLNNEKYWEIQEPTMTEFGVRYNPVKANLDLKTAKVIDCNPKTADKIFFNGRPVIVVSADGYPNELYVNIDPAIARGEIAWVYEDHTAENATELTPELMLACCIRSNNLPITDYVLQYLIKIKDKKLYQACLSDEFEYNKAKPEYEKMLKDLMAGFDFSKTYYIKTDLSIDKYNFQDNGYPVDFYGSHSQYFIPQPDFNFLPTNREHFKFLPVSPSDGEKANKRRKGVSSTGYIPSLAYGRVYMKLLDKRMELPKNEVLNMERMYRQSVIGAEILKMEVYDCPNCEYNLMGVIK